MWRQHETRPRRGNASQALGAPLGQVQCPARDYYSAACAVREPILPNLAAAPAFSPQKNWLSEAHCHHCSKVLVSSAPPSAVSRGGGGVPRSTPSLSSWNHPCQIRAGAMPNKISPPSPPHPIPQSRWRTRSVLEPSCPAVALSMAPDPVRSWLSGHSWPWGFYTTPTPSSSQ